MHGLSALDRNSLDVGARNGRSSGRPKHAPRAAMELLKGASSILTVFALKSMQLGRIQTLSLALCTSLGSMNWADKDITRWEAQLRPCRQKS